MFSKNAAAVGIRNAIPPHPCLLFMAVCSVDTAVFRLGFLTLSVVQKAQSAGISSIAATCMYPEVS